MAMRDVPQEWIRNYIDQLLDIAKQLDSDSSLQAAVLSRAEHAMDLVKAFREKEGER